MEKAQFLKGRDRAERLKSIFKLMEYDALSEEQEKYVISYEKQFLRKGTLSDRQCEVLEDIFEQAAEKI